MTVRELVIQLLKHPPETEVVASWEGGLSDPGEIKVQKATFGQALVIDVDEYGSYNKRHRIARGLERSEEEMDKDP